MTDGTFLSRVWPSIVALVGTVAVVFGLLLLFGDDGSGGDDDAVAGDEAVAGDDAAAGEVETDEGQATADPTAEPTGESTGAVDESGDADENGESGEPDAPATPVEAPPELRSPVGILNSTDITGLAAGAQERLIEGGWEVPVTTNYSGEVEGTTVYYPTEELRASAEALQAQFPEIRFVEPRPEGSNLTTERILVILAEDYAEAVGSG